MAISTRRASALRYGILRARDDQKAMARVSRVRILAAEEGLSRFNLSLLAARLFPYFVGAVAPAIYTPAGRAWRRTILNQPRRARGTAQVR